jgi:hypothetical protein
MAVSPQRQISAEKRRALRLLASSPDGCTMSIMMAHGLSLIMLAGLVRGGLASTAPQMERAGAQSIEVVRMQITDAGRSVLAQ